MKVGRFIIMGLSLVFLTGRNHAQVQATSAPAPELKITTTTEDRQKLIQAAVMLAGKPLNKVTVEFYVKRTFGNLLLGHDTTLEDGTAAVPFPEGLPGGRTGELVVIAAITDPNQYSQIRAEATIPGGAIVTPSADTFSRTLWAPQAPVLLILAITAILVLVWGTYGYIVVQLFKLRKGESE